MASKTTLNAKNLEALGAERLAELLIEISTGNAEHKRRLRMELVGSSGGAELAREVRKRLSSIGRAKSWIDWHKVKSVKTELESLRKTIVEKVAPSSPEEGFELIWQFLSLADSIFGRSDDGSGSLIESFHDANEDAGRIARLARISPDRLVEMIFAALQGNGYGQYDRLIGSMAPVLGESGLRKLQKIFENWGKEPDPIIPDKDKQRIGWSNNGPIYREDMLASHKKTTVQVALQQIADAVNDVDLYIAQYPEHTHAFPAISIKITQRLLSAGRSEEALTMLDRVELDGPQGISPDWQEIRADVLEALGRSEEAQEFRWKGFRRTLNCKLLREFLRRLPDFDDIEAEEKAFAYVQDFHDVNSALYFFLEYPSPGEASKLVIRRAAEVNGNRYGLMSAVAEKLAENFPLAATILLRSMIDFALDHARSSRYGHAARHLLECEALARNISDYGAVASHEAYVAGLRKTHGRKIGFWSLIKRNTKGRVIAFDR